MRSTVILVGIFVVQYQSAMKIPYGNDSRSFRDRRHKTEEAQNRFTLCELCLQIMKLLGDRYRLVQKR